MPIIAIIFFLLDRIIKYYIVKTPDFDKGVFVISGVLGIKPHINEFFAWSLPVPNDIIAVGMGVIIVFLAYLSVKSFSPAFLMIFAGAVSNFADRILYGGVVDYIIVPLRGILNIADIMIFFGVVMLIIGAGKKQTKEI